MDTNIIVQGLLGALGTVLWFLYRELKSKMDSTEKELLQFKVDCAVNYITNEQLTQSIDNLNRTLETVANAVLRVETRLNNLVDSQRM